MNNLVIYLLQKIIDDQGSSCYLADLRLFFHNSITIPEEFGDSSYLLYNDLKKIKFNKDEIEEIVLVLFKYISHYNIKYSWLAADIIGLTSFYTTKHLEQLINLMKCNEEIENKIKTYVFQYLEYLDMSFVEKHISYVESLILKYPEDENFQDTIEDIITKYKMRGNIL